MTTKASNHEKVVLALGINVDNLKAHRDFLAANKDAVAAHFDMRRFCYFDEDVDSTGPADHERREVLAVMHRPVPACGSSMCIVGWAPNNPALHGAVKSVIRQPGGGWHEVTGLFINNERDNAYLFEYLFGASWDNDLDLALERIDKVLDAVQNEDEESAEFLAAASLMESFDQCWSSAELDCLAEWPSAPWIEHCLLDESPIW